MEQCALDPGEGDWNVCEDVEAASKGLAVFLAVRTLFAEILAIQVPSPKEYALAFQAAFESSWESLTAWTAVLALLLSPVWQLLAALAKALWPHVRSATITLWRFQASLPLSTVCAEVAAVLFVILVYLLRRFIVHRRFLPRAQRRVRLFRVRVNRRYLAFTASVERNFRLSARAFPHVIYWAAAALFAWLAPESAFKLREKLWVWVTVTWPTLYALYLALLLRSNDGPCVAVGERGRTRSEEVAAGATTASPTVGSAGAVRARRGSPASPGEAALARGAGVMPHDVDRVLMYWVVYTMAQCCSVLTAYVPFAGSMVETVAPPAVRTAMFFFVVWMHLPGPGSGLQVVYALLEPLVHTYVRDLRPTEGYTGTMERIQDLLVFVRVLTKQSAEVLADNVADSWMLLPVLVFFFTPGFLTNLGCLYAGLVVPALNSIKTLGRRSNVNALGVWAALANPAGGARVRWLTYWVAYGGWWHVSWFFGGLLRILPLATHAQLVLFLWLQVPLFRGAGRILDFGENWLVRWTSGGAGAGAAAEGRENGG